MVALNRSKKPEDPDFLPLDETPIESLPNNMAKMLMGARTKMGKVCFSKSISFKFNFSLFRCTMLQVWDSSTRPYQDTFDKGRQDLTSTSGTTPDLTLSAESSLTARRILPSRARALESTPATVCHLRSLRRCTLAASSGLATREPSRGQSPSSSTLRWVVAARRFVFFVH